MVKLVKHFQTSPRSYPQLRALDWLQRDIRDFLGEFTGESLFFPEEFQSPQESNWAPRVDIYEADNEVRVTAELPGISEKDVTVELMENRLVIRGEKKEERSEKRENDYLLERSWGSFTRSFEIPATINQDGIQANFDKGVLTVVLPKSHEATPNVRRIEVKSQETS